MGLEQLGFQKIAEGNQDTQGAGGVVTDEPTKVPSDTSGERGAPGDANTADEGTGNSNSPGNDNAGTDTQDASTQNSDTQGSGTVTEIDDGAVLEALGKRGIVLESIDDIGALVENVKTLKEQNKQLAEKINPLGYFASKEDYIAEQVKMKHPEFNPAVVNKVLSQESLSDIDSIVYAELLKTPGVSEAEVRTVVNQTYFGSPEGPQDETDPVLSAKLKIDAAKARATLSGIGKDIEVPEFSPEEVARKHDEMRTATLSKWGDALTGIASIDKIPVDDGRGLSFDFETGTSENLAEAVNAMVAEGNLEPTPENKEIVERFYKMNVLYDNFQKILGVYRNRVETEMQKKFDAENHDNKPPNTQTNPGQNNEKAEGVTAFLHNIRGGAAAPVL